ncbi:MAG: CHAT domain-containing protein [Chitinophagales bacterium]|nr:CHAT domain-containing protein [Chitinophagales bacterium]
MNKFLLILVIALFFGSHSINAQSTNLSTALSQIDTIEILSDSLRYTDAICYGEELVDFFDTTSYNDKNTALGNIYNKVGYAHYLRGEYEIAKQYYLQTISLFPKASPVAPLAKAYFLIGKSHLDVLQFKPADEYLNTALKIAQQLPSSPNFIEASALGNLGASHIRKGNVKEGEQYCYDALALFTQLKDTIHIEAFDIYRNLASLKTHQYKEDEAIILKEKALAVINQVHRSHPFRITLLMNIGYHYIIVGEFDKAHRYLGELLNITIEKYGTESAQTARVYTRYGLLYFEQFDYAKAKYYYNKALEIHLKSTRFAGNELSLNYYGIAEVFRKQGDYEKAILYYQKDLALLKSALGDKHFFIGDSYMSLGSAHLANDHPAQALSLFEKGNEIYEINNDEPSQIRGLLFMAQAYLKLHRYDEAIIALQKLQAFSMSHKERATALLHLGKAYDAKKQYLLSIEQYQEAIKEASLHYKNPNDLAADIYINMSEAYLHQKNWEQAKNCLDTAASNLKYDLKNPLQFDGVIHPLTLFSLFTTKSQYLKYKSLSDEAYRDTLRTHYQQMLALVNHIQNNIAESASKQKHIANSYTFFEAAIANLIEIGTLDALEEAFDLAEKSKSVTLAENLRLSQASAIAGIPQHLLDKEYELNSRHSYYQHKLQEANNDEQHSPDSLARLYQDSVFNIQRSKEKLIAQFENQYPTYYNLKYNQNTITIKNIQKQLSSDDMLLEYFVGDSSLYAFVIQKDKLSFKRIKKDFPLQEWIVQLRDNTYGYWVSFEKTDSTYLANKQQYCKSAYQLYQRLIRPVEDQLTKNILIIPDGLLSLLPFDALLSQEASFILEYVDLPYLIKDHTISYDYSASIHFKREKRKKKAKNTFLGFAPTFEKLQFTVSRPVEAIRSDLNYLVYNQQEIQRINEIFDGNIYLEKAATKDQFLSQAEQYQLIHLATHAKANEQVGDHSFLAFTEKKDSTVYNDRLYVHELYNLDLKAEMVVLSACETGLGELKKGEGIVSLARSFTFAGAQSVVPSLWQVNDQTTANFMASFYQAIKEGNTKSKALRIAKLESLQSPQTAAPFFWAAFIPIGDMSPINDYLFIGQPWWFWFVCLFVITTFVGILLRKRKKPSPH